MCFEGRGRSEGSMAEVSRLRGGEGRWRSRWGLCTICALEEEDAAGCVVGWRMVATGDVEDVEL